MFEFGKEPGKSVIVSKAPAVIRLRDFESVLDIEKLIGEVQPKGFLLDWTELEGWDEEGESARFFARLELRKHFARVAVLGACRWDAEISRLEEVSGLPTRRFEPSDRQAALDWLDPESA